MDWQFLPLLTGCACICAVASALGCVFGTVFMLDVAFLGWASFDAVQGINGYSYSVKSCSWDW